MFAPEEINDAANVCVRYAPDVEVTFSGVPEPSNVSVDVSYRLIASVGVPEFDPHAA